MEDDARVSVIVTRAPLRVALGGGGTDLPSHYRRRGGFVVSAAIDKYVHMLTIAAFRPRYVLKHLEWEEAETPEQIRHPILREALSRHWDGRPLEIASVSDVPPGTGLGSSGAYAVCVLKALSLAMGGDSRPEVLAEAASELEIDVLGRSVGKQDQYAAAHGGVRAYTFRSDDTVEARTLELSEDTLRSLREEFLLFLTGNERSASDVLSHQVSRTLAGDEQVERNLARTEELARESCAALEAGDLDGCAELMDEQWEIKRDRAPGAIPTELDDLRALAKRSGALGVMLMGAGGGGFLLAYTRDPAATRAAMTEAGAPELPFDLDAEGCVGFTPRLGESPA
jgi:D-glycero-alpha-D-manno-heptose-7-phosphate kinase